MITVDPNEIDIYYGWAETYEDRYDKLKNINDYNRAVQIYEMGLKVAKTRKDRKEIQLRLETMIV